MLTKGHKIIIIIGAGVVAITIIIVLLVNSLKKPVDSTDQGPVDVTAPVEKQRVEYTPPAISSLEAEQQVVHNLSMTFAERFGTFSPDGGFVLIDELKPLMTEEFATWVGGQYKVQLAQEYAENTSFQGVKTEALAVNFDELTAESAKTTVTTKQYKKNGDQSLTISRDLRLEFVNLEGQWLVSGAYWEK